MATPTQEQATHDAMTRLLALARTVVAPSQLASVTMRRPDGDSLYTAWASADTAREIDELQYELRQGPCVEAALSGSVCHAVMTEAEGRWPSFVRKLEHYDVRSVLSTPLRWGADVLGAVNVYSAHPEPFGDNSQAMASELANLAAAVVALADQSTAERMNEVAASRDAIARAEGVLMAWQHCPPEEAFAILRRTSTRDNRRLRDVADDLLASVQRPSS